MQQFTPQGQQFIQDLAQRYGISQDAAITMVYAVLNGNGTMAQFSHPELGGSGQWMQGGMTMVGDMFNYGLKARVDGLCVEISNQLMNQPGYFQPAPAANVGNLFVSAGAAGQWWPTEFGSPSSTGGQNNVRYAVFPGARRLVVDFGGQISIYDTLDHQIGGVSQQQGSNDSLTFSSQYGTLSTFSLPLIGGNAGAPPLQQNFAAPPPVQNSCAETPAYAPAPMVAAAFNEGDAFAKIERLADLWQKGILTEQEFTAKKMELLSQI
jgi:hypothetical protein